MDIVNAAQKGLAGGVRHFLRQSPGGINERNFNGDTALHWAAIGGHTAVVSILIDAKSDLSNNNAGGR
eukprot:Skav218361  [mRNA]  locus=scaffold2066:57463:57726:+ [translate_table: standard]